MRSVRILAIDCGLERVGYSIFEKKSASAYTYIDSGVILTSKRDRLEKRLQQIHIGLTKLVKAHKPGTVILEQIFFFKNHKTVFAVAQAQGVIMLVASQLGVPVTFLTPLQIKQAVTGYGKADKKSVEKMLRLLLGPHIVFKTDDVADAVACGLAYCQITRH